MGTEQSQFQSAEGPRFLTRTNYSEQFKYDANRMHFSKGHRGLGEWYTELKKWIPYLSTVDLQELRNLHKEFEKRIPDELTDFVFELKKQIESKQAPKEQVFAELINEWNLTSENNVWLSLSEYIPQIQGLHCQYFKVGLKKRGLPCISIKINKKVKIDNKVEINVSIHKMPTCFLRLFLETKLGKGHLGKGHMPVNPELLKMRPLHKGNILSDWSHDILKKTYRKLNIPCQQGCNENMPETFKKIVSEMKSMVNYFQTLSGIGRANGWYFPDEDRVTPLEYINMFACMENKPAPWKVTYPITLPPVSFANLRPSNYFFGSTSTFKFNQSAKWVQETKEYREWLLNDCPDCSQCQTKHVIDFVKVSGRTCPDFKADVQVRFMDDQRREINTGILLREEYNKVHILFDGRVIVKQRNLIVSIRQPRVTQEYVGCFFVKFGDIWKNLNGAKEGWFDLGAVNGGDAEAKPSMPQLNPCWTFDDYQQNVVDRFSQQKSLLVNHYMGTGKTLTAIASIVYMRKYRKPAIRTAIIVMPNSIKSDWRSELTNFGVLTVDDSDSGGDLYVRDIPGGIKFYLWTYEEAIERMHTKADIMDSSVVIFDEAHRLNEYKNTALERINMDRSSLETRQTNAQHIYNYTRMLAIAERAQYMIMLTGTPLSKSVTDIMPLFNMLSQVETHTNVFPTDAQSFRNEYMYLDEKKASVTRYIRTHYKPTFGFFLTLGQKTAMAGGIIALAAAAGILPFAGATATIALPAIGVKTIAATAIWTGIAGQVLSTLKGQEKLLNMTRPRDELVLFRINAKQIKPIIQQFIDYFDNEDFESSAREYPYKVFRYEKVHFSAYQLILYSSIRLKVAGLAQQRLSDLLDYRTLSADEGDDLLRNKDRQGAYEIPAFFSRQLPVTKQRFILDKVTEKFYATYRVVVGVTRKMELPDGWKIHRQDSTGTLYTYNGTVYFHSHSSEETPWEGEGPTVKGWSIFGKSEYINDTLCYQVERYQDKHLHEIESEEDGYWINTDESITKCTAYKKDDIDYKKRLIELENGRTFQVSKFSKRWLPLDYVEVTFRPDAHKMVVGPFFKGNKLAYGYKQYPTASEAKKAHKTFLKVGRPDSLTLFRADEERKDDGEEKQGERKESEHIEFTDRFVQNHQKMIPMVSFDEHILFNYMSAELNRSMTLDEHKLRPTVITHVTPDTVTPHASGGVTPSTVPNSPGGRGASLQVSSKTRRKPKNIFERYPDVPIIKSGNNVYCFSPGHAAVVFADYEEFECVPIKWLGSSPSVDDIEIRSRMNDIIATNLRSHLTNEKLLRIGNLSSDEWSPKWETMWNKYLNNPENERTADIVCYKDGDDQPRKIHALCDTEKLPRSIVYSQFSEGRGGILDFCRFLMAKGAKQCIIYKSEVTWRKLDGEGIIVQCKEPLDDEFKFCLIDKQLPESAFEFAIGQKVRYMGKIYIVEEIAEGKIKLLRNRTEVRHVPRERIRPLIFGNRGPENTLLKDMFNGNQLNCVLLHYSITEGKSFKTANQIHIMEPMINPAQLDQVIARAVRKQSHVALPAAKRFVEVVQWWAVVKHDSMKQVGEQDAIGIVGEAVEDIKKEGVSRAVGNVLKKTVKPGLYALVLDIGDYGVGWVDRVPGWIYDYTGKKVLGHGPDSSPEKRGMRLKLKNVMESLEDRMNQNRIDFQKNPEMRKALVEMQLLWEQSVPDLRFLSGAFITENSEQLIAKTPDDLVFDECARRKDEMTQLKEIAKSTYNRDILKKAGIQEVSAEVLELRDDQASVYNKITIN